MPVNDPKNVFLTLLTDVRQNTERSVKFYNEATNWAQDPDVKDTIESRALIAEQALVRLDRCFTLLGEKPVKLTGRLQEMFIEDFRKEVAEIQSPIAKTLFVLAKISHLAHFRIGEYKVLVAAADLTGHYSVGVLIESCFADELAFAERTTRLIRNRFESREAQRRAA